MNTSNSSARNTSAIQPREILNRDQEKRIVNNFYIALPDVVSTIEDMVAEGDKVAFRVTHRGTNKGNWLGIAPTGNKVAQFFLDDGIMRSGVL